MLRAVLHLLNAWIAVTPRSSKTTAVRLPSQVGRPSVLPGVIPLTAMEGQTTPLRHTETTPSALFPTQSSEVDPTGSSCDINQPMSVLLTDLTSLILLSSSVERKSGYKDSAISFLSSLEKTVIERLKTMAEMSRDTPGTSQDSALVCNRIEAKTTAADPQRSVDMSAAISNGQTLPRPRDDLCQQNAADCTITDRPLCMTFDSGISSPASGIVPGSGIETEHLQSRDDATVTKELHHRLQHLKALVEEKLQESGQPEQGASLSEEIRDRLCKLTQASLASSRSGLPSAPEMFMEKALSSSLLVFENSKLSAEVAYLKKKVEILEDVAGTRGFSVAACMPTMETISIGSQTDEVLNQPSTLDEGDFGMSDFSLSSPETNCLMSTALCRDFPQPSGMSTPGVPPNKQRRKIEVPTQLKVSATSYSSINPWADVDDKQQNTSSVGCWRGLCACFYNASHGRRH